MTRQPAQIEPVYATSREPQRFVVRPLVLSDCAAVAALHRVALPESTMAALGQTFLESFYRTMLRTQATFCLVAAQAGQVLGFVSGSLDNRELYRQFARRHGLKLGLVLLPKLLLPSYRQRIQESRKYAVGQSDDDQLPELISLAVAEQARGQGVAQALVAALKSEFARRGVTRFKVMVGGSNAAACRFYEKSGGVLAREVEVHQGMTSRVYIYEMHE